jgi:hypothetical protein
MIATEPTAPAAAGWITQAEACRILDVGPYTFKAIALARGIRTRRFPGARVLYARHDVEAVLAEAARSVIPVAC